MSDKQIFISYSRNNRKQAEALQEVLQLNMWSVWRDLDDLDVGDVFREETKKGLERAKCVITLWSHDSVNSRWVNTEAQKALDTNKLLPVRLDDTEIPMPFEELHTADLTTWDCVDRNHRGLQRLLSSISKRVKPQGGSLAVDDRQTYGSFDRGPSLLSDLPHANIFDEVYVISDLNLASTSVLQEMNQGDRLARLIELLTHVRPDDRVALVINGDLIDFASEEFEGLVATQEAVAIIENVWRAAGFRNFLEKLAKFVQTPKRYLILVLGEKDLELALPEASETIMRNLSGSNISGLERMTVIGRSASFKCRVGHANVLLKHGHDVDSYNAVDYGLLSQLVDDLTDGAMIMDKDRVANAGRLLARTFIKSLRQRYPFVYYLQPAQSALLTLLALNPSIIFRFLFLAPRIIKRLWRSGQRRETYTVSGEVDSTVRDPGPLSLFLLFPWKRSKAERLRKLLLKLLAGDTTFSLTTRDMTFASVVGRVGTDFDYVVTGHTHLERAIKIDGGSRFYYNTGTWVPLFRFGRELLLSGDAFGKLFETLAGMNVAALEQLTIPLEDKGEMPFVLYRPTVLCISSNPRGVVGRLFHVFDSGPDAVRLEPIVGTDFWKE